MNSNNRRVASFLVASFAAAVFACPAALAADALYQINLNNRIQSEPTVMARTVSEFEMVDTVEDISSEPVVYGTCLDRRYSEIVDTGSINTIEIGVSPDVTYGSGKELDLFSIADSFVVRNKEDSVTIELLSYSESSAIRKQKAEQKLKEKVSENIEIARKANSISDVALLKKTSRVFRGDEILNVTAEDLNEVLFGRFAGKGEWLLELQEQYGVGIGFAVAVAQAETTCGQYGFGTESHNNPYNIRTSSGPYVKYDTFEEGVEAFFKLISSCYLNPEHSYYVDGTIPGIGKVYAEGVEWPMLVSEHMISFYYNLDQVVNHG